MPVELGRDNEGCWARWGQQGKKYHYECGNEAARDEAKSKAYKQGVAIGDFSSQEDKINFFKDKINEFALIKIGFDFDGVLSTKSGQDLWRRTVGDKYLVTARSIGANPDLTKVANQLLIPTNRIIFTNSNIQKILYIKNNDFKIFFDNNENVIRQLGIIGRIFK